MRKEVSEDIECYSLQTVFHYIRAAYCTDIMLFLKFHLTFCFMGQIVILYIRLNLSCDQCVVLFALQWALSIKFFVY